MSMSERVTEDLEQKEYRIPDTKFMHREVEYIVRHVSGPGYITDSVKISKYGMGNSVAQIVMFDTSLSKDDKRMLFHTVASNRWMNCRPRNSNSLQISPSALRFTKYLLSQGLSNVLALRLSVMYEASGPVDLSSTSGDYELEALKKDFERFKSAGYKAEMDNDSGFSNLESFFEIGFQTNSDVALQMLRNSEGEWVRMLSAGSELHYMQLHSSAWSYLATFDYTTFSRLADFTSFADLYQRRDALAVSKMLAEIDKTEMKRISRIQNKIYLKKSMNEVLDSRDYEIQDPKSVYGEFLYHLSKFDEGDFTEFNEAVTSVLIGRFGLLKITEAARIINKEGISIPKDIPTLIYVATYLEENNSADLPLEWIVALTEDADSSEESF